MAAQKTYRLIDHACRYCLGRIAVEIKNGRKTNIFRCTECGMEVKGNHDDLCVCGMKLRTGEDAGLRCFRNENITAEMPCEVVVRTAEIKSA